MLADQKNHENFELIFFKKIAYVTIGSQGAKCSLLADQKNHEFSFKMLYNQLKDILKGRGTRVQKHFWMYLKIFKTIKLDNDAVSVYGSVLKKLQKHPTDMNQASSRSHTTVIANAKN